MFYNFNGIAETIIFFSCFFVFCIIGQAISFKILAKFKVNGQSVLGIIITTICLIIAFIITNIIAAAIISF